MRSALFVLALLAASPAAAQDDQEIEPVPVFGGPHLRLGLHVEAGGLLATSSGLYGGAEALVGVRVTTELSIIGRFNFDLGGWDRQGLDLLTSIAAGAGVEYTVFDVFGSGSALSFGATGGLYFPDACGLGPCYLFAPIGLGHVAWFFGNGYTPTNPLAAFSLGVSGGAGYDFSVGEAAGRITLYFGYELSIN